MATTLTLRLVVGRPLTNQEVDNNFTSLNDNKLELGGGTMTGSLVLAAGSTAIPALRFNSTTSTTLTTALKGAFEFDSSGTKLYFTPASTRKLVILGNGSDVTGNYIATVTGTAYEVDVSGSGSASAAITVGLPNLVKVTTSLVVGSSLTPSATNGRIEASDDVIAFSTSDERLKTNIEPIADALNKVLSLRGVTFTWDETKKDIHNYEGMDTGVIAQDVLKVLPEVVATRDNGFMAVKYEKMIGLLVEAIKELNEKIEKCSCNK